MPGYAHISGSLHVTIHTAVLIDTLKALSSDLRWCYCKFFSTQDHTLAVIKHDESADVFFWKGESLKEYWDCILNDLIQPEDYGKGHRPDLIFDDGVDMTLLIHAGKKTQYFSLPISMYNVEFKIVQTIIKRQLEDEETDKWIRIVNTCMGFSEENSTGAHHMYTMRTDTNHQN